MSNYLIAFTLMMANEGGYILHTVPGDRGGMTYAGISRNNWPNWEGWKFIDKGITDKARLASHVKAFYKANFWDVLNLQSIENQEVANSIFDFAVNTGTTRAARIAQLVVGAEPDGIIGPNTLDKINCTDPQLFRAGYMLAKINRYRQIVAADKSQSKFLLGWLNRVFKVA